MQPKILKTGLAEYTAQIWTGKNESGAQPIGDTVLILPDEGAERTSGGVFIDARTQERHTLASETGILVDAGPGAWKWSSDRSRPFEGITPSIGQRVWFTRYSGQLIQGDDGKTYRVMTDNCVGAIKAA